MASALMTQVTHSAFEFLEDEGQNLVSSCVYKGSFFCSIDGLLASFHFNRDYASTLREGDRPQKYHQRV